MAVLYRKSIEHLVTTGMETFDYKTFEADLTSVRFADQTVHFLCIYRPPPSEKNKLKVSQFMTEFIDFLDDVATRFARLVILGDINLHFDSDKDDNVNTLKKLFPCYDLTQLVDRSTQQAGHILDWVIVSSSTGVKEVCVENKRISDHSTLTFSFSLAKPGPIKRTVTSRNLKSLNMPLFREDVSLIDVTSEDPLSSYNTGLRSALDKHAPLKTRCVTDRPSAPWLTLEVKAAKTERRRAERRARKSELTVHWQIFDCHCKAVQKLVEKQKREYVCNQIESTNSCKQLFAVTNQLL